MSLASSLTAEHFKAIQVATEKAFARLDKGKLLTFIIDTTPSEGLFYLASQRGVLGLKGWDFVSTDSEKRALIKKAIPLWKSIGTGHAIKTALSTVNTNYLYENIEIQKLEGDLYDGTEQYDGDTQYEGGFWAHFLVRITVANDYTVTAADRTLAEAIINEWKAAREKLVVLEFFQNSIAVSRQSFDEQYDSIVVDLGDTE